MIRIKDLQLIDIAATSTLSDVNTLNIYKCIDSVLKEQDDRFRDKLNLLESIDRMTNDELDLMFWGYSDHVGNVEIDQKRKLLKKAVLSRITRGTTGVLRKMCKELYKGFEVEEWFEYNGEPGKFKIKTRDESIREDSYLELIDTINHYKNVRSHLETVELNIVRNSGIQFAAFKEIRILEQKENRKSDILITLNPKFSGFKELMGVQIRNEI
ncbi:MULTISPECIES: phage tail protein [unclassified Fusobacterium]|uniref:phage tail protein n=1 Tax=unclassified Fusobacterium TaxID=2648384 RepID=UPI001B8B36E1|nr:MULTISPECIES: phage tail protein [unclassified Fusobacterium]MBR8701485.1 hypothetical protein [Fusobacterium sp. DD45]MBR8711947.1 hypothetical protein [Fusobacterium sp. DD28]MBR8752520.1 hypothetical protein [Fusobacterium sp. DD26]